MSVNQRARSEGVFLIFFNLKMVYGMFSLESPQLGDFNEYIPYTIFKLKRNHLYYPKSAARRFLSKGLKNEFETAIVNKPSVFEPLKVYLVNWVRLACCHLCAFITNSV